MQACGRLCGLGGYLNRSVQLQTCYSQQKYIQSSKHSNCKQINEKTILYQKYTNKCNEIVPTAICKLKDQNRLVRPFSSEIKEQSTDSAESFRYKINY